MKISIIMPVHNRIQLLKLILDKLNYQSYKDFNLILVDDHSDYIIEDKLRSLDLNYQVTYIRNTKNEGRAVSRNKGIEKARSDLLLFLDSDMYVEDDLLESYMKEYQQEKRHVSIIGNSYHLSKGVVPAKRNYKDFTNKIGNKEIDVEICPTRRWFNTLKPDQKWRCYVTNNASCYLEDALRVNGFESTFAHCINNEDVEFGYKLNNLGNEIQLKQDIVAYHLYHKRPNFKKEVIYTIESNKIFNTIHPEIDWCCVLPKRFFIRELEHQGYKLPPHYLD